MIIKGSIAALVLLMAAGPAWAQHGQAPAQQPGTTTKNLQGGNNDAWFENQHIHAFYDLTKETLGKDGLKVTIGPEFEAYRDKSYAIFRAFGASAGNAEMMVDHLKDIPRQMVGIVSEDPHVLDSFANFRLALEGPP